MDLRCYKTGEACNLRGFFNLYVCERDKNWCRGQARKALLLRIEIWCDFCCPPDVINGLKPSSYGVRNYVFTCENVSDAENESERLYNKREYSMKRDK